jgi:type IV pilus assembly protein PilC
MLTYSYKARNTQGELIAGTLAAQRRETVISALKQKGYYLLDVEIQSKLTSLYQNMSVHRVSVKEKAIFTHQLATLLKAGMKLTTALHTLSKQTQNKYLATVIKQMQTDIEHSSSLSEAMAKHSRIFSKVYTAIIAAAEHSGSLSQTLFILSQQLKSQASVNSRIRSALVYPIFLLVVSAAVVAVLTTFVIPKFIELFVNAHQALPLPTKILVAAMHFTRECWWLLLIVGIGITCFAITALQNARVKLFFHTMLLKLPIIGTLNSKLQLARFARTLGSLLKGGVKIIFAINTTKSTIANIAFARAIAAIEDNILKGSTLAMAISQQRVFSEIMANMIAVGEDTSTLPEMLLEIAEMYDQESESAINALTTLLGPLMIVILGLIIGFVVLAIVMPIFETSAMVG